MPKTNPNTAGPAEEKRTQNRLAQREWRQRRRNYLATLESQLNLLSRTKGDRERSLEALIERLAAENETLKNVIRRFQIRLGKEDIQSILDSTLSLDAQGHTIRQKNRPTSGLPADPSNLDRSQSPAADRNGDDEGDDSASDHFRQRQEEEQPWSGPREVDGEQSTQATQDRVDRDDRHRTGSNADSDGYMPTAAGEVDRTVENPDAIVARLDLESVNQAISSPRISPSVSASRLDLGDRQLRHRQVEARCHSDRIVRPGSSRGERPSSPRLNGSCMAIRSIISSPIHTGAEEGEAITSQWQGTNWEPTDLNELLDSNYARLLNFYDPRSTFIADHIDNSDGRQEGMSTELKEGLTKDDIEGQVVQMTDIPADDTAGMNDVLFPPLDLMLQGDLAHSPRHLHQFDAINAASIYPFFQLSGFMEVDTDMGMETSMSMIGTNPFPAPETLNAIHFARPGPTPVPPGNDNQVLSLGDLFQTFENENSAITTDMTNALVPRPKGEWFRPVERRDSGASEQDADLAQPGSMGVTVDWPFRGSYGDLETGSRDFEGECETLLKRGWKLLTGGQRESPEYKEVIRAIKSTLAGWRRFHAKLFHRVNAHVSSYALDLQIYVHWHIIRLAADPQHLAYMPPYLRPTLVQRSIPHLRLIDYCVFGEIRDILILDPPKDFGGFLRSMSRSMLYQTSTFAKHQTDALPANLTAAALQSWQFDQECGAVPLLATREDLMTPDLFKLHLAMKDEFPNHVPQSCIA